MLVDDNRLTGDQARRARLRSLCVLGLLTMVSPQVIGQNARASGLLARDMLPPQLRGAIDALGDRVVRPGNERVSSNGTLTKGTAATAVRVTRELPNKLRIENIGSGPGRVIGFDGNAAWASDGLLGDDDANMIETINDDSAEAVLYGLQSGSSVRVLGEHFRTDHGAAANYRGPWLDLFEMFGVITQRAGTVHRQKHLVFDSNSKFLLYVRYKLLRASSTVTSQTEWSGWQNVNGQAVPARVGRRENGIEVWNLSLNQIAIGPALADGSFSH
jgi:hypothetical protein